MNKPKKSPKNLGKVILFGKVIFISLHLILKRVIGNGLLRWVEC